MSRDPKVRGKPNYYLALDLMPGASHNDILHGYSRAKNTYSGGALASYSLMEGDGTESILNEIEEAFAILGNPSKRRQYDVEMEFNTWSDEDEADATTSHSSRASSSMTSTRSTRESSGNAPFMPKFKEAERESPRVIPMKPQVVTGPAPKENRAFGAEFQPNPEFEEKVRDCKILDGPFLKAVRIYRGYSAEALAKLCKLSTSHILTLENEDGEAMPAPVYLRGHVVLVCQSLNLPNAADLAKTYLEGMIAQGKISRKVL